MHFIRTKGATQVAEISINASKRTNFGKGASRRDRVAGLVPAVIMATMQSHSTYHFQPVSSVMRSRHQTFFSTSHSMERANSFFLSQFQRTHLAESLSMSIFSLSVRAKRLRSKFQFTLKVLMTRMASSSTLTTPSKLKQKRLRFLHSWSLISQACLLEQARLLAM